METWYVLDDDDVAAPADVRRQPNGTLQHRDGRAVQMKGNVPRSRSVDPAEVERMRAKAAKAKEKAEADEAKAKADADADKRRDMKADADRKPAYTTRESKAE